MDVPPPGRGRSGTTTCWSGSAPTSTSGFASADESGNAYLVPLSFVWDGQALTIATPRASRTAVNLVRAGHARVALGPTRDVVDRRRVGGGDRDRLRSGLEDAHARATGFDPRTLADDYVYLRITPRTIRAWREANELEGRLLMRDGRWLD